VPPSLALAFMEDVFAKFAAAQPGRGGALGTSRQQDAQEILDFFVDNAHDDLNRLRTSHARNSANEASKAAPEASNDDDAWLEVCSLLHLCFLKQTASQGMSCSCTSPLRMPDGM
jgi:ubiquitin C-terminal hydrolase